MKIWYLMCGATQEYAVVFANNEKEAFDKLTSHRVVDMNDINCWEIEELTEESYDGVLYFY